MSAPYETDPSEYEDIKSQLLSSLMNKKNMSKEEAEEQIEFILNL